MNAPLGVLFLTSAGPGIGLGHLRRCMALADVLRELGTTAGFAVAGDVEQLRVAGLEPPGMEVLDWVREPALAVDALIRLEPDAVIVDSYAATPGLLARLRAHGAYMAVIDDLGDRLLPVDLIVNGAYHAVTIPYRGLPETAFLLGPNYMPLDSAFGEYPRRQPVGAVDRILVTLGGDCGGEVLKAVLTAVRRAVPRAIIDLVVGPFAPELDAYGGATQVHRGRQLLRDLMVEAAMAITAAGVTVYECLAAGVPVVAVCLADNQRPSFVALAAAGLIMPAGSRLEASVAELALDRALRERLSVRGREIVDGRGARRVTAHIERATHPPGRSRVR